MGYDLIGGLLFAVLTPLVVVGFVVYWIVTARDREEHGAFFEAYARSRGLELVPAEGEWPNRTSAAIRWSTAQAEMRLSVVGRESRAFTRLTVRPSSTLFGELLATPDPETYAKLVVRARPASFQRRLVDERVERAILGFCQRDRVLFRYKRGRFALEWPGREANDARLDAARRVADEIVRIIDDEFRAGAPAHAA